MSTYKWSSYRKDFTLEWETYILKEILNFDVSTTGCIVFSYVKINHIYEVLLTDNFLFFTWNIPIKIQNLLHEVVSAKKTAYKVKQKEISQI